MRVFTEEERKAGQEKRKKKIEEWKAYAAEHHEDFVDDMKVVYAVGYYDLHCSGLFSLDRLFNDYNIAIIYLDNLKETGVGKYDHYKIFECEVE